MNFIHLFNNDETLSSVKPSKAVIFPLTQRRNPFGHFVWFKWVCLECTNSPKLAGVPPWFVAIVYEDVCISKRTLPGEVCALPRELPWNHTNKHSLLPLVVSTNGYFYLSAGLMKQKWNRILSLNRLDPRPYRQHQESDGYRVSGDKRHPLSSTSSLLGWKRLFRWHLCHPY